MAEYVIMPKADYESACDATRAKTGKTDLIKSGELGTEIGGITVGADIPDGTNVDFGVPQEPIITHAFYNGVRLPLIPANILNNYPYVIITQNTTSGRSAAYTSATPWYYGSPDSKSDITNETTAKEPLLECPATSLNWLDPPLYGNWGITLDDVTIVVWASHDIRYSGSGTVYFKGTDFIEDLNAPEKEPVYSFPSEVIDQLAYAIQQKTNDYTLSTVQEYTERVHGIEQYETETKTISPDFSTGDMVVTPTDGSLLSEVTIQKPDTLLPENIALGVNIAGVVGTLEAGTSDDVRYVTFMNGETVLYVKPVAVGDDCVDVLSKGLIETPTKESTAQYTYTYYGWGASDGGAADSTILQNITEDKTVYAIFTAAVRYYTITYLDDDGATVLHTKSFAYGSDPTYIPEKDGYKFVSWTPELATVTEDASYQATWMEVETLEGATWARISELSVAGEISNYFSVGDTKSILLQGSYGGVTFNETYYVYIVHFGYLSTVFGCFKNAEGVDLCLVNSSYGTSTATYMSIAGNYSGSSTYQYRARPIRYYLGNFQSSWSTPSSSIAKVADIDPLSPQNGTLLACFPEALRAVMKTQTAYDEVGGTTTSNTDYLRLLGEYDIFGHSNYTSALGNGSNLHYSYYQMTGVSPVRYMHNSPTTAADYWIMGYQNTAYSGTTLGETRNKNAVIATTGKVANRTMTYSYGIAPIFFV